MSDRESTAGREEDARRESDDTAPSGYGQATRESGSGEGGSGPSDSQTPPADDAGDAQTEGGRRRTAEALRQTLGVFSAFREAVEETFQEARERGDLSTDRARELLRDAAVKAKTAAGEARGRLDFVSQQDFDDLKERVERLEARIAALDGGENGETEVDAGDPDEAPAAGIEDEAW